MKEVHRLTYATHAELRGFAGKVEYAKTVLARFLAACERPYVAFSGGKDSTACLVLLHQMQRTDVPVMTQVDDFDWPEKREHCERVTRCLGFTEHEFISPDTSAEAQFAERGFIHDVALDDEALFFRPIRDYVARRRRTGSILGLRAEESYRRRRVWRMRGRIYRLKRDGHMRCLPVATWSGVDVFALLVSTRTPWFHLYDRDDDMMPHERRMQWLCNPLFAPKGAVEFLRRYYPQHYRRVVRLNDHVRRFT